MKTTKKDFALFKKEVDKWKAELGLAGYRITTGHMDNEENVCRAWYASADNTVCSIFLSLDWEDDEITSKRLKRSAFHELNHVLFTKIHSMLVARGYSNEEAVDAIHNVIHTYENYFYGDDE